MPYLYLWGGAEDESFSQDFDTLARSATAAVAMGGHTVYHCDHSELELVGEDNRHSWPDVASDWVTAFLLAHPMDVDPLPYAEGFPEGWPMSCATGAIE